MEVLPRIAVMLAWRLDLVGGVSKRLECWVASHPLSRKDRIPTSFRYTTGMDFSCTTMALVGEDGCVG